MQHFKHARGSYADIVKEFAKVHGVSCCVTHDCDEPFTVLCVLACRWVPRLMLAAG